MQTCDCVCGLFLRWLALNCKHSAIYPRPDAFAFRHRHRRRRRTLNETRNMARFVRKLIVQLFVAYTHTMRLFENKQNYRVIWILRMPMSGWAIWERVQKKRANEPTNNFQSFCSIFRVAVPFWRRTPFIRASVSLLLSLSTILLLPSLLF